MDEWVGGWMGGWEVIHTNLSIYVDHTFRSVLGGSGKRKEEEEEEIEEEEEEEDWRWWTTSTSPGCGRWVGR